MCVKHFGRTKETCRSLLPVRGHEPGRQLGGYPSAVLHLDALRLDPLADLGTVQSEADTAFTVGLVAEAVSQGPAGGQDGASDSDPLTLAEYVTQCPKIFVR